MGAYYEYQLFKNGTELVSFNPIVLEDDWVNEVLTKFYNDVKPGVEYEKIFQNLKK